MLGFILLPWLYVAITNGYAVLPRDGPKLTDGARERWKELVLIFRNRMSDPNRYGTYKYFSGNDVKSHILTSKQKVERMLAVGDSYTAGIGSNGDWEELGFTNCSRYEGSWPMQLKDKNDWNDINDGKKPDLIFGACSGNVMKGLRENQLKLGDPVDTEKNDFTPIGKPQIAVLTISGNDAKFSKIINDCVFRIWLAGEMSGCDQRLEEVEGIVASAEFKKEIMSTYAAVIQAGRDAKGADPPEAFQAFVGGYVGLWNHDDEPCDHVYWNLIRWGLTYKQWLTRPLRKRFNDLVDSLNKVIKEAATELEPFGVFHVEGYNDGFVGRRFCEHYKYSCIHAYRYQDYNQETGFWSYQSRHYGLLGGEGPAAEKVCNFDLDSMDTDGLGENILLNNISEVLVPNEEDRKKLSKDLGPWNVTEGDWDNYEDIFEALRDRGQHDPVKAKNTRDYIYRMFHPKASGYTHFADK